MTDQGKIMTYATCLLTIYLNPCDRTGIAWYAQLLGRPVYLELVIRAKEAGLVHAIVRNTLASYTGNRVVFNNADEIPDPGLLVSVEMLGERAHLEDFCRSHAEILAGKTVMFREAERWEIEAVQNVAAAAK